MLIKTLFLLFIAPLFLSSCLKNEPVTNDSDIQKSFFEIQNELLNSVSAQTPEDIKLNDFLYFSESAKFYSSAPKILGYKTIDTLEKSEGQLTLEDGSIVPILNNKFLESSYKVNESGEPVLETRMERACRFARDPYYLWLESCDLQPFQDYYLYYLYTSEDLPYFYNFKKTQFSKKLPYLMEEKNNCFGNSNCTINITQVEFDIIFNKEGQRNRQHILLWLTKDLPYLASNPKKCISTLIEYQGQKHPYEFCQELVNFIQE